MSDAAEKTGMPGIGFAIFLLLAGITLLGERLGGWPSQIDWLFPVLLIAWGASELYHRVRGRGTP